MARTYSADIAGMLPACKTITLVELTTRGNTIHRLSAGEDVTVGNLYTAAVIEVGNLKETLGGQVNRLRAEITNVAGDWWAEIKNSVRQFERADVVFKRHYIPLGSGSTATAHLFTGKVATAEVTEQSLTLDVVDDIVAAGSVAGIRTLSPVCWWKFKSADCLYSGAETTCDQRYLSIEGCRGRVNQHRFGGFFYNEKKTATAPTGGGGEGGGGGGGGSCFPGWVRVMTDKGLVPIERVEPGDRLAGGGYVKSKMRSSADYLMGLVFPGLPTITVKPQHRFFRDGCWVKAEDLRLGDVLTTRDGREARLQVIRAESHARPVEVFNLMTSTEDFWVEGLRVHNNKDPDL